MTEEALIAVALREEFRLPPKVDLQRLAKDLKLSIAEVDSLTFDGALLRNSRRGRILVRRGIREIGRKRFTIAHEIGHYILHNAQQAPCSSRVIEGWKDGQPEPERQADIFASELLLPTADVAQLINKRWPSISVVRDIADHFGSTMMAAARKFCDVAPQVCAVIWSSQSKIRWFHPSPKFTYFTEVGREIGLDSCAYKAYKGIELPDDMQEVPAEEWISSFWLRQDAVVSEQSLYMPFYDGCLSLIWVRRDVEDRPTVEDELLSELTPEGFTLQRKRWPC